MSARNTLVRNLLMGLALFCASSAMATTLLEFDFRQTPVGTDVAAVTSTQSAVGELIGYNLPSDNPDLGVLYPTVNTGPTGVAGGSASLASGALAINRADNVDTRGLRLKNTASTGSNNRWIDFFGSGTTKTFGAGTIAVVFKPNFSGLIKTTGSYGRLMLFTTQYGQYSSNVIRLGTYDDAAGAGLQISMGNATGGLARTGAINWDSNSWYMVVASWSVSGQLTNIYFQDIDADPNDGQFFSSSVNLVNQGTSSYANPLYLGLLGNAAGPYGENANSQIAYFRMTDQYTADLAAFQQVYSSLIPEPAAITLLGLGALAMVCRRSAGVR